MFPLCNYYEKNDEVQLSVILRISKENQNPVDMHTSIMCINILQNIKAVGGDSRTNHVSISRRTNRGKLICPPTLHCRGIKNRDSSDRENNYISEPVPLPSPWNDVFLNGVSSTLSTFYSSHGHRIDHKKGITEPLNVFSIFTLQLETWQLQVIS